MAGEDTCTVAPHGIPDVAIEVVLTRDQQMATLPEGNRSEVADDIVIEIHEKLLVSPQVIGACGKGIGVCEKSHSIDVRFMAN